MAIFPFYFQGISLIIFNKFVAGPLFKTSSAETEMSDGPHKGVLRRAGPNTKRSIYFNIFCFYLFVLLVMFLFLCSGLGASKDRFVGPSVGLSVGPYVEKNLKSLNEQNYAEFNSD